MKNKIHKKDEYCAGPNCDCGFKAEEHTPTPCSYENVLGHHIVNFSDGYSLDIRDKEYAAFIVRACNSHEMLLRALKGARQVIRKAMPLMDADDGALFAGEWIDDINEAINKAEGK